MQAVQAQEIQDQLENKSEPNVFAARNFKIEGEALQQHHQQQQQLLYFEKKLWESLEKEKTISCTCNSSCTSIDNAGFFNNSKTTMHIPSTSFSSFSSSLLSSSAFSSKFQSHSEKKSSQEMTFYILDLQILQRETNLTFNHLSHTYSELLKHPGNFYSRPQIGEMCHEKAQKKSNSFINALSKEIDTALEYLKTNSTTCKGLRQMMNGEEPRETCFIFGKREGKPSILFLYFQKKQG